MHFCPVSAFNGQQIAQGMGDSGEHSNKGARHKDGKTQIRDAQELYVSERSSCYPKCYLSGKFLLSLWIASG